MQYPTTFELPTTDSLTGLVTPVYFRHLLSEQLLPEAQRTEEPLSLFFLDIDGLLETNAQHGQECGHSVVRGVADTLKAACPDTAVVSRYGGDEFAVALPETRLDDAFTVAEEIRREVIGLRFETCPEVTVTCSIGLASFPAHGNRDVELMREADQALYLAKTSGRNKVSLPLGDSRMITKTSHYTATQLERLAQLAKTVRRNEASLLREALDDLLRKHKDRLEALNRPS
jgi:diguanylate cyclase (GGDEF)-like protein